MNILAFFHPDSVLCDEDVDFVSDPFVANCTTSIRRFYVIAYFAAEHVQARLDDHILGQFSAKNAFKIISDKLRYSVQFVLSPNFFDMFHFG